MYHCVLDTYKPDYVRSTSSPSLQTLCCSLLTSLRCSGLS